MAIIKTFVAKVKEVSQNGIYAAKAKGIVTKEKDMPQKHKETTHILIG